VLSQNCAYNFCMPTFRVMTARFFLCGFSFLAFVVLSFAVLPHKSYAKQLSTVTINEDKTISSKNAVAVTGSSNFYSDSETLVVYIDTPDVYYVFKSSGDWSTTPYLFDVGNHIVAAVIYDNSCLGDTDPSDVVNIAECLVNDVVIWNFTISGSSGHRNVFRKDTRCLNSKPPLPTWSAFDPTNQLLTWSAVGGNKVELKFGYTESILPFDLIISNDGHEKTGVGTVIGWFGGFWKMRTINGCRVGDWSEVYRLLN